MGTVIQFPLERLSHNQPSERRNEPATVIILPTVRMERWIASRPSKLAPAAAKSRTRSE